MKCLILLVFTLLEVAYCQTSLGDKCTIEQSQAPGSCTLLKDCQQTLNDSQIGHTSQTCSVQENEPVVCCPQSPKLRTNVGEISRKKCKEYAALVNKKVQAQNLISNASIGENCGSYKIPPIVDGRVSFKQFPHMALIGIGFATNSSDVRWMCAGSLISEEHILIAGLCSEHPKFGPATYALLGSSNDKKMDGAQKIKIVERIVHLRVLAILKLEGKVEISEKVRPACLATDPVISPEKHFYATRYYRPDPYELSLETMVFTSRNCTIEKKGDTEVFRVDRDAYKRNSQCRVSGVLQAFHSGDDIFCMYDVLGIAIHDFGCWDETAYFSKAASYIEWIEDTVWPQSN